MCNSTQVHNTIMMRHISNAIQLMNTALDRCIHVLKCPKMKFQRLILKRCPGVIPRTLTERSACPLPRLHQAISLVHFVSRFWVFEFGLRFSEVNAGIPKLHDAIFPRDHLWIQKLRDIYSPLWNSTIGFWNSGRVREFPEILLRRSEILEFRYSRSRIRKFPHFRAPEFTESIPEDHAEFRNSGSTTFQHSITKFWESGIPKFRHAWIFSVVPWVHSGTLEFSECITDA